MNKLFTTLLAILFISNTIIGQSAKEIAKNCLPSTVSLVMEDGFKQPISLGSGFIIDNGKVVTNLHVIEGAKYGYVFINGSSTKHKIQGYAAIDKQNDLAILSVPTITEKSLPLVTITPEIGEKIYAIGNPKGLSGTISEGIISGIRNLENKELIQITAPISPGSSGGPVINNSGQVIGVAVGTLTSGQNLNFAIPSSLLKSLIAKGISSLTPLNISKGATAPKTAKNEIDVKEGLTIRDWKYETGITSMNVQPHHKLIKSISIRNQLPYTVKKIHVIFILFDKSGIPVDYFEETYFDGYRDEGIKPFLAKTITFFISEWGDHRALRKEYGENLEVRILDFEIVDE
ncbi:MAG: S1-C subfamily serine protease [Marinoscillum sp.]|jgi:S1-C subfamily serine protease